MNILIKFFIRKIRKAKPLFVWLLLLPFGARSQNEVTAFANTFYQQNTGIIKEQAFVHTDKNFYLAGEIIWFKIYIADAEFHKPLNLSKVGYIELLDTAGEPVLQAKIAVNNGDGKGSLYLPLTIASGNYKLRAYTNWMKNFDAADFFEKDITIINVQKLSFKNKQDTASSCTIHFYPEGGNLVANIRSKVAFKAVNKEGKGIAFKGSVINGNDTVLTFKPDRFGIGCFYFTPEKNHAYKAFIQPEKGGATMFELPAVEANGYVMNVADANDSAITVSVETNIENAPEVYVIVHTNTSVTFAKKGALQNGKTVFNFSKAVLPDGVSNITVFNDNRQPVCERLYFKKPVAKLQLSLNADKPAYEKRKPVNMVIGADNATGSASLSMAVYRLDSLQSPDENTIDTYFLLTANLHGAVENPAFYLSDENTAKAATDNLMLVNGWRKFKTANAAQNNKPLLGFAPEYNGHIITGEIINNQTGKPQSNIEVYLSVPGTRTQLYPCLSDSSGAVKFEMNNFYGSSKIIVQTNSQQDSGFTIHINDPFSNAFLASPVPYFNAPEKFANTLLEHSISMQVQNIYSSDQLNKFHFLATDTSAFYLHADKKYLLDNYTRFTTLEEVLREYVALVNVTKKEGKYHFPVYDFGKKSMFENDPLVLVDGVPVFNLNRFIGYDPLKMKSLEVVNKRYFLGSAVFDGILNWQTYNGDLADFNLDPHTVILDYEGLQLQREFYAPAYETEEERSSHLPDFRNVLYWKADLSLKEGETKQLSFYTSDLPGEYAVVLQGMDGSGLCGSSIRFFEVKK